MKSIIIAVLLSTVFLVTAQADEVETEKVEIEALITSLAGSGCEFERNGSRHSAEDAAEHLRLKYRRGGKYVSSAETFIDRLASKSSWSGKAYTVACPGKPVEPAADWLYRRLQSIRGAALAD
ncbi:hypothetical protein EDC56_0861 [Sinobacterium caligoides]|uniref:DUF5329 domain-containing protein n=1 Tax=Sinobacterium caligoides TaxID=933926 RepID=A0A3N2DZN8_9GAMM|nr:DUF5329 domain-containing protein [Sinobacterium caligoides]ROS05331.1 hypothetical protein EDC56_0861 [Sinobacterium caligoides]